MDINILTATELLALHSSVEIELLNRGVIRSFNKPCADLAEYLFCQAFGWRREGRSFHFIDATGIDGQLYQIKSRRLTENNPSRQLGEFRELPKGKFNILAGVLFAADYSVMRAALIPHALVLENASRIGGTNSWKFLLRDEVWEWPGVKDVTSDLRAVNF